MASLPLASWRVYVSASVSTTMVGGRPPRRRRRLSSHRQGGREGERGVLYEDIIRHGSWVWGLEVDDSTSYVTTRYHHRRYRRRCHRHHRNWIIPPLSGCEYNISYQSSIIAIHAECLLQYHQPSSRRRCLVVMREERSLFQWSLTCWFFEDTVRRSRSDCCARTNTKQSTCWGELFLHSLDNHDVILDWLLSTIIFPSYSYSYWLILHARFRWFCVGGSYYLHSDEFVILVHTHGRFRWFWIGGYYYRCNMDGLRPLHFLVLLQQLSWPPLPLHHWRCSFLG